MPYRTELKRPDLKGRFPCSVCGKVFCHSSSLSRHRMQAHFKSYTCTQCNMEISSSETLRTHMVNSHAVSRLFMCRCCNWAFSDKTTLHIHMQSMSRSGQPGDVLVLAKSSVEGDSSFIDYDGGSPSSSPHENDASSYMPSPDNVTSADLSLNSKSLPAIGNSLGSATKSLFPADFLNALNGSGGANSMLNKLSAHLLAANGGGAGATQQHHQQNGTIFPNGNGIAAAAPQPPQSSQQLNRLDLLKKFRENSASTASYEDSPMDPSRALMNMLNNISSATTSSNSLLTAAQAPLPSATTSQATTAHKQMLKTWLENNPICAKALQNESTKLSLTNASSNEGKAALIAAAAAAMAASRDGSGNPPPPVNNFAGSTSQFISEFSRLLAATQQGPSATLTPPTKRSRFSAGGQPSPTAKDSLFDAEALKLRIPTGGHHGGRGAGGGMSSSGALSSTSSTTTTSSTSERNLQDNKQRRSTTPSGKLSEVIGNILSVCGGGADDTSTEFSLFDMAAQAQATDNESGGRRNKRKARVPQQLTPHLASINYQQEPTKEGAAQEHNFLPASKSSALDGFANNLAAQKQQQQGGGLLTTTMASAQSATEHHYEQPSPTISDSQTNETSGSCGGGGASAIVSSAKKCAGCQELNSKLQLCEARVKELEEALATLAAVTEQQQQPPRSASQEAMDEGETEEGSNDVEGVANALLATVAAAINGGGGVEEEEAEFGEEDEELVSSGAPPPVSMMMKSVEMTGEKFPLMKESTSLDEANCRVKKEECVEDEAERQRHA